MRRLLALVALSMFVTTACTDSAPTPTDPGGMSASIVTVPGCPTPTEIRQQITGLFPLGQGLILAQATFDAIVIKVALSKTAEAQKLAAKLIQFTNNQFSAGKLRPTATAAKVATLNSALACFVGLTPANATDVTVGIVDPNQTAPTTTVVAPSLQAGIQIKKTDVNEPTVVTVFFVAETLLTDLRKYPKNYQFSSSAAEFNTPVLVGLCPDAPPDPISKLRVAHNVPDPNPTGIEILPSADPGPLGLCPSASLMKSWSRDFALSGLERFAEWFAPAPLSATAAAVVGGTGIGGTTKKLSVFGAVDPTAVEFQSDGWFFKQISNLDPVPGEWTTIAPTVENGSTPGAAPFGSADVSECGLPTPATAWSVGTTILLRRDVFVPLGTSSMTIDVLIDNDVHAFVNGWDISGGNLINEGCANQHPLTFTAYPGVESPLRPGEVNKIFIRGTDRGVQSYLDAKITFQTPSP